MAGIALTLTGTDNDDAGGSASGIAASYAMGALTVNAATSNESDNGEDDTSLGLSYAMDSLTVGYTTIKPGRDGGLRRRVGLLSWILSWRSCSIFRS